MIIPASNSRDKFTPRTATAVARSALFSFLSNDYLGLSRHPEVVSRAQNELQSNGLSVCSSRVVGGSSPVHGELERELARFYGSEAALVFSSGYLANLGVITTLVSRGDALILDRLCHASLYDAARLSGAKLYRFQHNSVRHLEELLVRIRNEAPGRRIVIATESVFSMDGDEAPLEKIATLCKQFTAKLVVDEAHAIGAPKQSFVELLGEDFVRTTTLSKSLGSLGGAVVCSAEGRERFVNEARSFIFDTALAPLHAAGALAALELVKRGEVDVAELYRRADFFRGALRSAGFDTGKSSTQIVPLIVGDEELAVEMRERLSEQGILVGAIRTPTVPRGGARLRFGVSSAHTVADLEFVADAVQKIGKELGVI